MKGTFIYRIEDEDRKKQLNLVKYSTLAGHIFWTVLIYDFKFYYDDGYTEIFHGEYTSEEDAVEEFAYQMDKYETYKWVERTKKWNLKY